MGIPKHDKEGRVISLEYDDFNLVTVYTPNSGDQLLRLDYRVSEWDRDFQEYVKDIEQQTKKPVIVAGDLNVAHNPIDVYDPKHKEFTAAYTEEERKSFQRFLDLGFVDTYRQLYPDK